MQRCEAKKSDILNIPKPPSETSVVNRLFAMFKLFLTKLSNSTCIREMISGEGLRNEPM
jgi:hypothetical protein